MSLIKQILKSEYSEADYGYRLSSAFKAGFFAAIHRESIQQFHAVYPEMVLNIDGNGISFCGGDREQVLAFLKAFGGDWEKAPEDYYPDKIKYTRKIQCDELEMEYTIEAGQAPPPPSCRIEETEEFVPASVRKVRKIVCPKTVNENPETVEVPIV